MLRIAIGSAFALILASGCSKPAATQEGSSAKPSGPGSAPPSMAGETTKVAVPGAAGAVDMPGGSAPAPSGPGAAAPASGRNDDQRLKPDEGKLAIEPPAEIKPGVEASAKIVVTPAGPYHVNADYPASLTLDPPPGITIAKAKMTKGDAQTLDEKQLAFAVKFTAAASGSYTINGKLKFAVCDKDSCLPKLEPVAIAIAAK